MIFLPADVLVKTQNQSQSQVHRKKTTPKTKASLSFLLLHLQGRPGPKGDPGDPGLAGLQVRTSLYFVVCEQETGDYPQRAVLLLEPGFSPHGWIKTTLGVGGLPCHPQGVPHSQISPLIDKR